MIAHKLLETIKAKATTSEVLAVLDDVPNPTQAPDSMEGRLEFRECQGPDMEDSMGRFLLWFPVKGAHRIWSLWMCSDVGYVIYCEKKIFVLPEWLINYGVVHFVHTFYFFQTSPPPPPTKNMLKNYTKIELDF